MGYEAVVTVTREFRIFFEDNEVKGEETPEDVAYDIAFHLGTEDSEIVHTEVEVAHYAE